MTVIRPGFPSQTPPQQAPALDPGRAAAQRAFFAAALGQAPAAPAQPDPGPARPVPVRAAEAPAEPPKRILRPGSLLDIRV